MGHLRCEKYPLSSYVELNYLAILELDQVDIICHANHVLDRMLRDFDDLLVQRLGSVVDSEDSSPGCGDQEVSRDLVDPSDS